MNAGKIDEEKPIERILESGGKPKELVRKIGILSGAHDMKKAMNHPDLTGIRRFMVDRDNKESHY